MRVLILAVLFLIHPIIRAAPIELRTAAQDSAPKYLAHTDAMQGLCVDIINAIQIADPQLRFRMNNRFVPLARIEAGLENGLYDVFFGLIKTPDREKKLVFIDTPLYLTHGVLGARADDRIEIQSFDEIRNLPGDNAILAVRGTAHVAFLQRHQGLNIDDGARTNADNLNKLLAGRGRFVFHTDISLVNEIRSRHWDKRIRILPTKLKTEAQYLAVSKKVAPDTVRRLKAVLELLRSTGELDRIFSRYIGESER